MQKDFFLLSYRLIILIEMSQPFQSPQRHRDKLGNGKMTDIKEKKSTIKLHITEKNGKGEKKGMDEFVLHTHM